MLINAGGGLSAKEGQELGKFVSVAFVLAVSSLMVMLAALYSRRPAHLEHVRAEQHTESIWIQAIAEVLANFRLIAGYAGSREKEIGIFAGKYKTYCGKAGGRVVFEIHSANIVERVVVLATCAVYLLPAVLTINNADFVMFVLAYMRLGGSVKNIAGHLHTLERSVISLDRIQQIGRASCRERV